ncbi:MAG: alkaline phosphatase family protein [Deltaproteobacteria bacterium]|nr:alkaline phosphatase family protein [Deltaproteobacteria bacterium]
MSKKRVLIFGFDGATFDLIKPWIKQGKLPAFAKLMKEGTYGELKSSPDTMSPSAWASFSTGKNPGGHGIYNFMDIIPGTVDMHYLNSTHRDGETIWGALNKSGKKTIVLNVPMTYPADKVDGCMITGWNAPNIKSKGFTYPDSLIDDILKEQGDYVLFPTVKRHMVKDRPDLALKEIHNEFDLKTSVTRTLMKKYDWDFLVTVVLATDQVQHYFWHFMDKKHRDYVEAAKEFEDAIYGIYKRCDDFVTEILATLDEDTTIIVMSDHGNGINQGGVQFMVPWLSKIGMMADFKNTPPSLVQNPLLWSKSKGKRMLKKQYVWLNNHLSVKAKGFLNGLFPGIRDRVESSWRLSAVDWKKTKCFFHYSPRVNLKGREPFGIIEPGKEYNEILDLVIQKLYESRDTVTGECIVDKVFKRDEVFHGAHIDEAPDTVVWWKEGLVISGIISTDINGKEVVITEKDIGDPRTGNHTPYGIFIGKGKEFRKGVEVKGLEIIDLAPTVLHIMGEPVPSEMDGKVAKETFTDAFLKSRPIQYTKGDGDNAPKNEQSYSPDEEKTVEETLRGLGYIE